MVSFNFLNLLINNISFYTTSLFFIYFLISCCLLSSNYWKKILYSSSFIINFFIINVITILLLFILFFFFKHIYMLNTLLGSVKYYKNYTSIFSDTLVLLAIIVTIISWVFLSERYLMKTFFFVVYFLVFIICTINMVYTTNVLVMFIFFEFIFLPSLFFVYQFGYSKKVEKTIAYLLLWTLTGSFIVLFGIIYLFSIYKTLDISNLNQINFSSYESFFLFFIFFFGFGIKIPLWPFHYWLTKVHVEAPTGFSIFLSGFLVKTAFFCLTYFFVIFNNKLTCLISSSIVIWGAIDASIRMWSSNDIKKLIAFATIQEMNLIMFLFIF
jgi:NADH-quinone oxidoreductase subunit M